MSKLREIVEHKRTEVEAAKAAKPVKELRAATKDAPEPRDFFTALIIPGRVHLIAEVKLASPSQGAIREFKSPAEIAKIYQDHGATCISVLTDERYFQGKLEYLREVRAAVRVPVLRKDFIIDSYQLIEARAAGADAVLLIAECLDDCNLRALHNEAIELGLTPLVEYFEPPNLERVLEAGATLIGINNRNLHTLEVDFQHAMRERTRIPGDCVAVAESAIKTWDDVKQLAAAEFNAMLVGTSLMSEPDIGQAVDRLLGRG
jgi:indole-3-glycerol phosphate synthase